MSFLFKRSGGWRAGSTKKDMKHVKSEIKNKSLWNCQPFTSSKFMAIFSARAQIARRHGMSALWFLLNTCFCTPFASPRQHTLWTFNEKRKRKKGQGRNLIESFFRRSMACENWCCHKSFPSKALLFTLSWWEFLSSDIFTIILSLSSRERPSTGGFLARVVLFRTGRVLRSGGALKSFPVNNNKRIMRAIKLSQQSISWARSKCFQNDTNYLVSMFNFLSQLISSRASLGQVEELFIPLSVSILLATSSFASSQQILLLLLSSEDKDCWCRNCEGNLEVI